MLKPRRRGGPSGTMLQIGQLPSNVLHTFFARVQPYYVQGYPQAELISTPPVPSNSIPVKGNLADFDQGAQRVHPPINSIKKQTGQKYEKF